MLTPFLALAAVTMDHLLGEPARAHPLVAFGRVATAAEARLNRPAHTPRQQRSLGVLAVLLLLGPLVLAAALAQRLPVMGPVSAVLLLYLALGAHSLREHAQRVAQALRVADLTQARAQVGRIVSRDTCAMQATDVARAAVESVLENGNDAVFGALFWFVLAGAPGVVLYRVANTLDAMWGYRTPRYQYFGWAAARLDDLLNYVPARLTACTYGLLGRCARAWRCWRRQARAWKSPNAGPVMAAGAGALGVQLGGPAYYHGQLTPRPPLGEGDAPTGADIERALTLVERGMLVWLLVMLVTGAWW
jgi:adenosylcobinamide-phosphate synthase